MSAANAEPDVAIIIPVYNAARFVAATLRSVQDQTLKNWKLILVDDGSTDNSVEVLASFLESDPRMSLVQRDNGGVAAARNTGVQNAPPSEFIYFLDADDLLEPNMLKTLSERLKARPDAPAAFADITLIDDSDAVIQIGTWRPRLGPKGRFSAAPLSDEETATPFRAIFAMAGIVPSMVVMRRDAFMAVGGWDEAFGQIYEDTSMFLDLARQGDLQYVAEPLVRYRRHDNQSTSDPARFASQEVKLLDRYARLRDDPQVLDAWRFRERRVVVFDALNSARRTWATGNRLSSARFLLGAARIVLRSVVLGPSRGLTKSA